MRTLAVSARLRLALWILPALGLGLACSTDSPIGAGAIVGIRTVPDSLTLVTGQDSVVRAFPLDHDSAFIVNAPVAWSSDAPGVATVNDSGRVHGVALGTANIRATSSGFTSTIPVTVVTAATIALTANTLSFNAIALGAAPPSQTVNVTNAGGAPLTGLAVGTITYGPGATGWLTASLDQPSAPAILTVSVSAASLSPGNYSAIFPLTSPVAGNSPDTVTVNFAVSPGAPTKMSINAGNGDTAVAGVAVATPPSVLVTDANNFPVGGVAVTFAPVTGGGSVGGGATSTNPSGVATVGSWTLGNTAGPNTLTATAGPAGITPNPITFTATGIPGGPATIAINTGNNQSATVNNAVPTAPSVRVTDTHGNGVAGVSVTFTILTGGGSLIGGSPQNKTTDGNGFAASGAWTLGTTAGANTLSAASGTLTGSPLTFTATGNAGSPNLIAVNGGNGLTAIAGKATATPPSVIVRDQFNNPVQNVSVSFAVSFGGGTLAGGSPQNQTTGVNGIATAGTWTLGTTAGLDSVTATAAGIPGSPVRFSATGIPGAPASIAVSTGDNQSASAGTAVPLPPAAVVRDSNGNGVPNVTVSFALASGGGSLAGGSPQNKITNGSGIATAGAWTLGNTAGANTVTASSASLTGSPVTFHATGNPGNAAFLVLNGGDTQTDTVGVTLGVQYSVLVTDNLSNPVQGVSVSWAITGGGGTVNGAASVNVSTDVNGVSAVTRVLGTTAGSQTASASVGGLSPSVINFTATALPGPVSAAQSTVGVSPATITASLGASASTITVTAKDQFGNSISGASVTLAATPVTGNSLTQPAGNTNGSGVTTGTLSSTKAEGKTVSANINGTAITQQPVVTVIPDVVDAAQSSVGAAPTSITASSPGTPVNSTITVTARDQFSNPISGATVALGASGTGNTLTQPASTTNGSGVATGALSSTSTANTKTVSATANGTAITQTATVTITPAAVSAALSAVAASSNSITAGTSTTITVTLLDGFSNPVPGATVSLGATGTGNTVTQPGSTTNGSGVTTGSVSSTSTANTKTVSATVTAPLPATLLNQTQVITVTPAAPNSIVVNAGNGQTARVGAVVATAPSVLVRDAFLNPVATNTSVSFSGNGTLGGNPALTNASGIATITSWTLTNAGVASNTGLYTNTLTVTAGSVTATNLFSATAFYTLSGDVQPILTTSCVGCHGSGGIPPDMTAGSTRANTRGIVSSAGFSCNGFTYVSTAATNAANSSILYLKTTSPAPCGSQMPTVGPLLTSAQQNIIRDWINHGSPAD